MGASVKGKKRYYNKNECKYFVEGQQPEGWVLGTPELTRKKASDSVKALWESSEYRDAQFEARHTEDFHDKIVGIIKKSWEVARNQRSANLAKAAQKRFENIDEHEACSSRMKLKWQDEDYHKKQSASLKSSHTNMYKEHPEYKQSLSKSNSKAWERNKNAILSKQYATKSHNNSWNASKLEEQYYNFLLTNYNKDDIIRQYNRDERYPFNCDFYIISEDKFIEIQGTWTHGGHPFDETNPDDIEKLNKWVEKAKTSPYYKNAIKVWTETDVIKRNTALKNNINIEFVY